jgi:hypothetical protein
VARTARTVRCSPADARLRLRTAQAYLDVATTVLRERADEEYLNVTADDAILAGIAASDAICGLALGVVHRGDDHHGAEDLLRGATHDGQRLATTLRRLLSLKDAAHYGAPVVSMRKAADATKWAAQLVERARQEAER